MSKRTDPRSTRFASPGAGWGAIGRQLICAADSLPGRDQPPALPAGAPGEVLAKVAAELGPRELSSDGVGESAALASMAEAEDDPRLVPAAPLADLIARVVLAPAELPIGVVTAFVGAPFFAGLLWVGAKHR